MYTIGGQLYHSDGHGNMLMHSAKGTEWGKHKYIDKIRKNGKWVYTYAKKTAGNVSEKITGKNAKAKVDRKRARYYEAKQKADNANARINYEQSRYGDYALRLADDATRKRANELRAEGNYDQANKLMEGKFFNSHESTEKEDLNDYYREHNMDRLTESAKKANKQADDAFKNLSNAKKEYSKTLAGSIQYAKEDIEDFINEVIKKKKKK